MKKKGNGNHNSTEHKCLILKVPEKILAEFSAAENGILQGQGWTKLDLKIFIHTKLFEN